MESFWHPILEQYEVFLQERIETLIWFSQIENLWLLVSAALAKQYLILSEKLTITFY